MRALPIGGAFFWLTTANGLDPPLEDRRAFPKLHPSPPTAAALGQQRSAIGQRNQSPAPSWASDSAIATVAAWSPSHGGPGKSGPALPVWRVHPSPHISRQLRRSLWLDSLAVSAHWSCPQAPGCTDQRGDIFPETGGPGLRWNATQHSSI